MKKVKNLKKLETFEVFKIFESFPFSLGFEQIQFLRVFELQYQSCSQNVSAWSGKSIGVHYMDARAVARAECQQDN